MSYDFSPANPSLIGTFNSTYTTPMTLGVFVKYTNHPESVDWALTLHKDANNDEYMSLQTSGTADRFDARQSDSVGNSAAFHTSSVGEYDGVWVPWMMTSETTSLWNIFVELITNTDDNTTSRDPGPLGEIVVGTSPTGVGDWVSLAAEMAIWEGELANADLTSYMNGNAASGVDASNLRGYWPGNIDRDTEGTLLNEGTDIGGTLTITNAVFNADHPIIIQPAGVQTHLSMGGIIVNP